MKLVLNNQCTLTGADRSTTDRLRKALTMKNPAYIEAKKHGRWTGKIDKILYFYDEVEDGSLSFPRGFISGALDITGKNIVFEDKRRILPQLEIHFYGELRPYQEKALNTIHKKDFAVLESLTGSGKTVIALSLIATRRQPTLIIVSTVELLNQWCDMIGKFLAINAGRIGNGKFEIRPITVGIVNTVSRHLAKLPQCFGQIVFDEVHRMSCPRMIAVAKEFDCKMMFSCSATPYRRDGLTKVIHFYAGPLVHKISPSELQEIGAVLIPEIIHKQTDFHYNFRDDYTKMLSVLTQDETRNAQIAQDILEEATTRAGTVLVVSDRIKHCLALADLLLGNGVNLNVKILTSQLKTQERTALVEDIRNGKIDVVIATIQLVGEGVDISNLSSLFFATPIKFGGRVVQVVGRILRPADGKVPRLYDYQDPISVLYASARARQVTYRKMGWLK